MDSIRIRNFRSIGESKNIRINKINLLLGRNSSGKSSFVRLFPMLRATAKNELRGPVLWFDENYDFGSFNNTLCRHRDEGDDCIMFGFSWTREDSKKVHEEYYPTKRPSGVFRNAKIFTLNMYIGQVGDRTILKKIELQADDHMVVIAAENNKANSFAANFDGRRLNVGNSNWDYTTKGILPNITFEDWSQPVYEVNELLFKHIPSQKLDLSLITAIRDVFDTDDANRERIFDRIVYLIDKQCGYKLDDFTMDSDDFNTICDFIIIEHIINTLFYVDRTLTDDFNHSYYITPLRYNNERYMRNQDLSVDNIESSGKNVMEYILSLKEREKNSYLEFLQKTLKCKIEVLGQDTKSIFITNELGETDNIVDVGHGYSQILPIATMLWDRAYKGNSRRNQDYIVIEQPEVHLHPYMQGRIAVLLYEALSLAEKRSNNLRFIIETHSPVLVNRLGKFIYNNNLGRQLEEISKLKKSDGTSIEYRLSDLDIDDSIKIKPEDVSVYLFNKDENGLTEITNTEYDESGRVKQWPIGFLD